MLDWTKRTPILCCFLPAVLSLFSTAMATDPVIYPLVVSDDSGNAVDQYGNISWATLPAGIPYKAKGDSNVTTLQPFYDLSISFINSVFLNRDLPYDIVEDLVKQKFDVSERQSDLIQMGIGFGICVAIALLFIIIVPIVGCCFCCCRCCNNCGGKRLQKQSSHRKTKCLVFTLIGTVVTLLMGVGVIVAFLSNDRLVTVASTMVDAVNDNLNDVMAYAANTVNELKYASITAFNITAMAIKRDLSSVGALVGIPVREELKDLVKALDAVENLDSSIKQVTTALVALNASIAGVGAAVGVLKTDLSLVRADITAAKSDPACATVCDQVNPDQVKIEFDPNQFPDISTEMALVDKVKAANLKELVAKGRKEFQDIPWTVQNKTQSVTSQVESLLDKFSSSTNSSLSAVTNLPASLTSTIDTQRKVIDSSVKPKVAEYKTLARQAGMGYVSLFLLIFILQLLGITFGILGYSSDDRPTERGCCSNCGGIFLMSATGLIFIFSWIFMLITLLLFVMGAPLEHLVCRPLKDPTFKVFDKLVDNGALYGLKEGEYYLGQMIAQNPKVKITIKSLLLDCKDNGAVYKVFHLKELFDVNTVTNYTNTIDIKAEIDKMKVDLSQIKMMTPDTEKQLNDFKASAKIDFKSFLAELNRTTTKVDLAKYGEDLRSVANAVSGNAKTKLESAANRLDVIQTGSYKNVYDSQIKLKANVQVLELISNVTTIAVDAASKAAKDAEALLATKGEAAVKQKAREFANRILGTADQFVKKALHWINNDIGKCRPVWNVYHSIVQESLCHQLVQTLNGFWFSFGWCLLCMTVSLVFNVKLAKHYRRMLYEDNGNSANKIAPIA